MNVENVAQIAKHRLYIEKEIDGSEENKLLDFWRIASEALEKETPKNPKEKNLGFGDKILVCPKCETSAISNVYSRKHEQYPYCPWCGQKLKVEEVQK